MKSKYSLIERYDYMNIIEFLCGIRKLKTVSFKNKQALKYVANNGSILLALVQTAFGQTINCANYLFDLKIVQIV